jgi:hypothetical protein
VCKLDTCSWVERVTHICFTRRRRRLVCFSFPVYINIYIYATLSLSGGSSHTADRTSVRQVTTTTTIIFFSSFLFHRRRFSFSDATRTIAFLSSTNRKWLKHVRCSCTLLCSSKITYFQYFISLCSFPRVISLITNLSSVSICMYYLLKHYNMSIVNLFD